MLSLLLYLRQVFAFFLLIHKASDHPFLLLKKDNEVQPPLVFEEEDSKTSLSDEMNSFHQDTTQYITTIFNVLYNTDSVDTHTEQNNKSSSSKLDDLQQLSTPLSNVECPVFDSSYGWGLDLFHGSTAGLSSLWSHFLFLLHSDYKRCMVLPFFPPS